MNTEQKEYLVTTTKGAIIRLRAKDGDDALAKGRRIHPKSHQFQKYEPKLSALSNTKFKKAVFHVRGGWITKINPDEFTTLSEEDYKFTGKKQIEYIIYHNGDYPWLD